MSDNPEEVANDLSADLAALRRDLAQLAASVSALVNHQTHAAGAKVAGAMGEAGDRLAGSASRAAEQVKHAGGEVEACITRNPLTAAMVAFGVGLTIGLFSRARQ